MTCLPVLFFLVVCLYKKIYTEFKHVILDMAAQETNNTIKKGSYSSLHGFDCVSYDDHPRAFYQVVHEQLDLNKGINGALISALAFQFFAHSRLVEKQNAAKLNENPDNKDQDPAKNKQEKGDVSKPRLLVLKRKKEGAKDESALLDQSIVIGVIIQIPSVLFISEFDNLITIASPKETDTKDKQIYATGSHKKNNENDNKQENENEAKINEEIDRMHKELIELIILNLNPIDDSKDFEVSGNRKSVELIGKMYNSTKKQYGKQENYTKIAFFDENTNATNENDKKNDNSNENNDENENKENNLFSLTKMKQNIYCLKNTKNHYDVWIEHELAKCKLKIDFQHKIFETYFGHFIFGDKSSNVQIDLVRQWYPLFCKDVGLAYTKSGEDRIVQMIASKHGYFWAIETSKNSKNATRIITVTDDKTKKDIELELVSFAAFSGFTPNMARIGFVCDKYFVLLYYIMFYSLCFKFGFVY